jgi:hypothetical protein
MECKSSNGGYQPMELSRTQNSALAKMGQETRGGDHAGIEIPVLEKRRTTVIPVKAYKNALSRE